MNKNKITFIINGNTYNLCAEDSIAIAKITAADRAQLTTLLESLNRHSTEQHTRINPARTFNAPSPERIGKGDADALMAQLIQEEKKNQKPILTKLTIYKYFAGFAIAVFLIVVIF